MPARPSLPVDAVLPELVAHLRAGRDVVLEAPTGSGKTTRVPPALLEAGLQGGGGVVVLEPRRIAARLAARRVAFELGEPLGQRVGYQVRFERQGSAATKVWFVTEGLLTRRLLEDEALDGVSVVVFDEFHERSLNADLGLGLVREIQSALRPDLRVVVMSATLDTEALAVELGASVVRTEGRSFPVAIEHDDARVELHAAQRAAKAVLKDLDRSGGAADGDFLVFLPGVGEIVRCADELRPVTEALGIDVRPLYAELPVEQQELAVKRGPRPRIVLATNVAETSLTLDGITTVVDTGVARVLRHDPRTGVDQLLLEKISRASAEQRAGRAGRVAPGRCLRTYTAGEYREMAPRLEPEILRVDLCEPLLQLKAWGIRDARAFPWITAPPEERLRGAERLLRLLEATDADGAITPLGRELLRFPVHPRTARMLIEASRCGAGRDGALLAALCEAPPVLRCGAVAGRSDLFRLADAVHARSRDLDGRKLAAIEREATQLERLLPRAAGSKKATDDDLLRCVLAGFPDRVARRRGKGGKSAVMARGFEVQIGEESAVKDAEWFVVLDVVEMKGGVKARVLSEIAPEWLRELFPHALTQATEGEWNEAKGKVEGFVRTRFLELIVEERKTANLDPAVAGDQLKKAALHPRMLAELRTDAVARLLDRVALAKATMPDAPIPALDDAAFAAVVEEACANVTHLDDLKRQPLVDLLRARLGPGAALLDRLVPDALRLPSGRIAPLQFRPGQAPLVVGKIQEFFGQRTSPRICDGRLAVAADLVLPNQRSIQITSDLENFWTTLYPKERKELARRYPRHPWPEDPWNAPPTHRALPRKR
jgi:ATP-dependent helicase HrpB